MNEDESKTRSSALVSGTLAEHIEPGLLSQRQKQDLTIPARPMSPAFLLRQNQQSRSLSSSAQDESSNYRLDPVRRPRTNEPHKASKMNTSRLAARVLPAAEDDGEQANWQYATHISSDQASGARYSRTIDPAPSGIPSMIHGPGVKSSSRGNPGPLRPTKSLRQRFNVDDGNDLSSGTSYNIASLTFLIVPDPPETSHAPVYSSAQPEEERRNSQVEVRQQDFFPRVHSRSGSVASSIFGRQLGQDEDISSVMMRGATDLRNAKYEIEEQASTRLGIRLQRY